MNYSELLQLAKGWGNFISDRIIIWRLPYTPLTRVLILISNRLISTNFYAFICFANFPYFMSWSHIPRSMYFIGFVVIFDCSESIPFQPYPPNFILGKNSFCFLKLLVSYFSNLVDNLFPFGGIWG